MQYTVLESASVDRYVVRIYRVSQFIHRPLAKSPTGGAGEVKLDKRGVLGQSAGFVHPVHGHV